MFAMYIKILSSLAFVPLRDVKKRFEQVVAVQHLELQPLAIYFERSYVGSSATEPIFPISFWDVYDREREGTPRPSNFVK
jgi:hypothetical protein